MKTDRNQQQIVKELRGLGVSCEVNHVDILCGFGGRTFWFELKASAKSPVRKCQRKLESEWKGHYQIVWNLQQILKAIDYPTRAAR